MGKWTRRAFLSAGVIAGGGLAVGVAMRPGNPAHDVADLLEKDGETLVHSFIKIDADNILTAIVPHGEMGQGAQTALAQMLADELDADWSLVRVEEAPALAEYATYSLGRAFVLGGGSLPGLIMPTFEGMMMSVADYLDLQITGGSMSIRVTGAFGMRIAGAATREMLRLAAADAWQVPFEEVTTANSRVLHEASSRSEPYATFAAAAANMTPSYTPQLKDPKDFKIMGKHVERFDIPAKVDGSALFALDVRRPGMVYATVVRAPVFGARVAGIDDTATRAVNGVIDVVHIPATRSDIMVGSFAAGESVAVVAEGYWAAKKGLEALEVEWEQSENDAVSSETIFAQFDRDISAAEGRETDVMMGDLEQAFSSARNVIEADYRVPFLAHTCMEPLNATAEIAEGRCDIWIGCQNPLGFRRIIAGALGFDEENVHVHNLLMGGGFGRKSRADWALQTVHVANAVGRPVQLIWSREEDVRQDFYRPAAQSRFRAALDEDGELIAWENTYVNKQEPPEAPLIPYAVQTQNIGYVSSPMHVTTGAWRSVDHSQHGFFTESFIDEVADAAGKDPYEFRAALLKGHPRHLAVLEKAATEADWYRPLSQGRGRGISLQESFGSIVAQVAEVTIIDGQTKVDRVVAAIDPGLAISPDGLVAQIESGIIYGLTAALYGEITIEGGATAQSNFYDYEALRMADAPKIETHVINSGHAIGGAGEPGTPGIAPAVANAVFNATGVRARQMPLNRYDLSDQVNADGAGV